jgi:hypothetical protein
MITYLFLAVTIMVAWILLGYIYLLRTGRWEASLAILTMSAAAALGGSLGGFIVGSFWGNGPIAYAGGELCGGVIGGGIGSALGILATSASRVSNRVISAAAVVLYIMVALIAAVFWLLINLIGDCFDNETCVRHQQYALPQAVALFVFFLAVFMGLVAVSRLSARRATAMR